MDVSSFPLSVPRLVHVADAVYRKRQNEFRFERLRRAGRVPRSG
jgi:hypothetical protein